jgi:hypothetical protein
LAALSAVFGAVLLALEYHGVVPGGRWA